MPDDTRSGRVYFRSNASPDFYYVQMNQVGGRWEAVVPRPEKPLTESVEYYIESVNGSHTSQTEHFHSQVSDSCDSIIYAGTPNIVVGATVASAATVPTGFSAAGITGFVNSSGVAAVQDDDDDDSNLPLILLFAGLGVTGAIIYIVTRGDSSPSTP